MTKPLWFGVGCFIPREVAVCPECGGELTARSMQWDEQTGQPDASAIDVICAGDPDVNHRWWQSTWQPVNDCIAKWCDARVDYGSNPAPIAEEPRHG